MSKPIGFYRCLSLRSIVPLGDFYVVHCQYLERCGIWRTLETDVFFKFDSADCYVESFLKTHNKYHRCLLYHFTSPAIVAGYEVKANK